VKHLEVTIMGQSYRLACPDGEQAELLAAAARVDGEMAAIRDKGRLKSRERIAVLAALNFADQLARGNGDAPASVAGQANPDSADLDALIRKLDQALSQDGRLL